MLVLALALALALALVCEERSLMSAGAVRVRHTAAK